MIRLALVLAMCWASQASAHVSLKPPAEYDRPFAGETKVIYHPSSNIAKQCGIKRAAPVRGCGGVHGGVCVVQIARYATISDPAMLIRHEVAHCNGWKHE